MALGGGLMLLWVATCIIGMIVGASILFVGIAIGRAMAYAEVLANEHDTDYQILMEESPDGN